MKKFTAGILLACLLVPVAQAMTVEEAYRLIPHKKTDFNASSAKMTPAEVGYLEQFFELVNLAIVERVQTLQWFRSGGTRGRSYRSYQGQIEEVLAQLQNLDVPAHLKHVHRLVIDAIHEQRTFYERWKSAVAAGKRFRFNGGDPLVRTSHAKLIEAYYGLLQLFPNEQKQNKEAFFDHLCALDFI